MTPEPVLDAAAASFGRVLRLTMKGRRANVARHQRRVRPELSAVQLDAAIEAAFDSYTRYYVETFRLPSLDADTVAREFIADGYDQIPAALARGNGVILALPHLGGWEWAGRWIAERPLPISVVVEPLEPPELFEWFVDLRAALGMTAIPVGPGVATACLRSLRENHVLCLLCDRDLDGTGVAVEFFGEGTTLPAGPATFALRTGAPILPTAVYLHDETPTHRAIVGPALPVERRGRLRDDVARVTQDLACALEDLIRRAPEQWHLFQPLWPSDPGFRSAP